MTTPTPPAVVEIDPWELRDPSSLVREVAQRVPFTDGTACAVLVGDPAAAQQVVAVEHLGSAYLAEMDERAFDAVVERLDTLGERWDHVVRGPGPSHEVVTFLVRRGLCVWGTNESRWVSAWRNATFSYGWSDLVVVTEHGWSHLMSRHADHEPAMVDGRRDRRLRLAPDAAGPAEPGIDGAGGVEQV